MNQRENPYASPQQAGETSLAAGQELDRSEIVDQIARHLKWSRGWIYFLAILLSLFTLLALIGILITLINSEGALMAETVTAGVILGVIGLLGLVAAMILFKAAIQISHFVRQPSTFRLEQVIRSQKSFLNLVGLSATVITVLFAVSVVFIIFGTAFMGY